MNESGKLIAVIGDEDTVTGFVLAGVGHRTVEGQNFLVVKSERSDIGIILINQHVANDIRHVLRDYTKSIPTVLEIPSKDQPYDPDQDFIMQRVNMIIGGSG